MTYMYSSVVGGTGGRYTGVHECAHDMRRHTFMYVVLGVHNRSLPVHVPSIQGKYM